MKKRLSSRVSLAVGFCLLFLPLAAHSQNRHSLLQQEFNLVGEHSQEIQYYRMESKLINYALDGTRLGTDVFRLALKCVPAKIASKENDQYTCVRFTFKQADTLETTIPALENWTYVFNAEFDETGQVLGIEHSKFENLTDSEGKPLPFDKAYHVYNAFIDFHAFCNVFAQRTSEGNGIQHLRKIGQKIVHDAAFSEAPTNLGTNISEGSFFKNGEITLEFRGLSLVNGRACALVAYDSGESAFKMIMKPVPEMEIQTVGSSHYMGEIYKDLATNWVQKITMSEFVVSETTVPISPNKIHSIVERDIVIQNVREKELFDAK